MFDKSHNLGRVISIPAPTTVTEVLAQAVRRNPDHPFLKCAGRETTTGELRTASDRVAGPDALGRASGDRVAVMMANVPEFLEVWFGILRCRAIEVPVHSAYRGPLLEHILAESGARILFCDAEFVDRLAGSDCRAGARDRPRELDRPGRRDSSTGWLRSSPRRAWELPPVVERRHLPALYVGHDRPSKGVVLTHTANLKLAHANVELMEYTDRDVLYTAFPLFHVNAKYTSVASALLSGASLVLDDRLSASRFWERMREEQVTSFNYMGTMLTVLAKQPRGDRDRDHTSTAATAALPTRRCGRRLRPGSACGCTSTTG